MQLYSHFLDWHRLVSTGIWITHTREWFHFILFQESVLFFSLTLTFWSSHFTHLSRIQFTSAPWSQQSSSSCTEWWTSGSVSQSAVSQTCFLLSVCSVYHSAVVAAMDVTSFQRRERRRSRSMTGGCWCVDWQVWANWQILRSTLIISVQSETPIRATEETSHDSFLKNKCDWWAPMQGFDAGISMVSKISVKFHFIKSIAYATETGAVSTRLMLFGSFFRAQCHEIILRWSTGENPDHPDFILSYIRSLFSINQSMKTIIKDVLSFAFFSLIEIWHPAEELMKRH